MSDAVARLNAALEGRYTIERELGEGGMATVYLADDIKHERKYSTATLRPSSCREPGRLSMPAVTASFRRDLKCQSCASM